MFGLRFCTFEEHGWIGSKTNPVLQVEREGKVDRFGYLDNCISLCGFEYDEINSQLQRA